MVRAVDLLGKRVAKPVMDQIHADLETYRSSSRRCTWPACDGVPRGSHVVSETFLRHIASGGVLVSPRRVEVAMVDTRVSPIDRAVPASGASVFRGYCDDHEKCFRVFEDDPPGRLCAPDHLLLQLCRTVASELEERTQLLVILDVLKRTNGWSKGLADLDEATRRHSELLRRLLEGLHADLDASADPSHSRVVEIWHGLTTEQIDVALSYVDFLRAASAGEGDPVEVGLAVAVIPQPTTGDGTQFLVLVASDAPGILEQYLEHNVGDFDAADTLVPDPVRLSRLVESWIEKGCFTWWMAPERWSTLPERVRERTASEVVRIPRSGSGSTQ